MSESCPMTSKAEFERQLALLRSVRRIAVVGMSPNQERPSYEVGMYLQDHGFEVIPVHPTAKTIGFLTVFNSLDEAVAKQGIPDLVDLFVAGDRTPTLVRDAHRLGVKKIWFQPGAENAEAETLAKTLGMDVVSHACTMAVLERSGG